MKKILAIASALLLSACASYTDSAKNIRLSLYSGEADKALDELDKSDVAKRDRDKVLYHMERGMILYTMNRYQDAAAEWGKARDKIDELYTVSVSSQAAALAISESYSEYEGEEHEQLLVTTFTAMAYFANNEPQKAIVEARKSYEVLNALNKKDEKGKFSRDAFTHLLAGWIYETRREWDAAIVEYRNALEAAAANSSWSHAASIKLPIAQALASVAELRNRSEILTQLKKEYPGLQWNKQVELREKGEVFVIYEAGKSPLKVPADVTLPVQGNIVRVSFPAYKDLPYSSHTAEVFLNNESVGKTTVAQDIGALAKQALADRRVRDTVRMVARVIAKDQAARAVGKNMGPLAQLAANIAGAATETADTRAWTFLPDTLQVLRIPVAAQIDNRIVIKPIGGKPFEVMLNLKPGEKRFVRYRTFN